MELLLPQVSEIIFPDIFNNANNIIIGGREYQVSRTKTKFYWLTFHLDMHDGGTDIKILLNDKPVCTSEAIYGAKMTTGDGKDWKTISRMTDCERPFTVKKGDNIKLVVNYDESAHPARESHGQEQEEMGMVFFTFVPS